MVVSLVCFYSQNLYAVMRKKATRKSARMAPAADGVSPATLPVVPDPSTSAVAPVPSLRAAQEQPESDSSSGPTLSQSDVDGFDSRSSRPAQTRRKRQDRPLDSDTCSSSDSESEDEDNGIPLPLADHVSKNLAQRVSRRRFVRIEKFSPPAQRNNAPMSINVWLTAFHVFMAVHLTYFPADGPLLCQYVEEIREASELSSRWREYDERFRRGFKRYGRCFGRRDPDLWYRIVYGKDPEETKKRSKLASAPSTTSAYGWSDQPALEKKIWYEQPRPEKKSWYEQQRPEKKTSNDQKTSSAYRPDQKPCLYFATSRGCVKGAACTFSHRCSQCRRNHLFRACLKS